MSQKKGKYKFLLFERWSRKIIDFFCLFQKLNTGCPRTYPGCHVSFVSNDVNTRNVPVGKMFSGK
jgi:hypothetical protein